MSTNISRIQKYADSYVIDVKRHNPCFTPCIHIWQLRELGYSDKQILSLKDFNWSFFGPSERDLADSTWWQENFDRCLRVDGEIRFSLKYSPDQELPKNEPLDNEMEILLLLDRFRQLIHQATDDILIKIHESVHFEVKSRKKL